MPSCPRHNVKKCIWRPSARYTQCSRSRPQSTPSKTSLVAPSATTSFSQHSGHHVVALYVSSILWSLEAVCLWSWAVRAPRVDDASIVQSRLRRRPLATGLQVSWCRSRCHVCRSGTFWCGVPWYLSLNTSNKCSPAYVHCGMVSRQLHQCVTPSDLRQIA